MTLVGNKGESHGDLRPTHFLGLEAVHLLGMEEGLKCTLT